MFGFFYFWRRRCRHERGTGDAFGPVVNGEPFFVGKDVAEILGYRDTSDALKRHVNEEDKLTRRFTDSGQSREMYVINESGLYSLILSSKLPTAKQFKHWVTSEILPTVRKHGAYMTQETLERVVADPDFLIGLLTNLKEEKAARAAAEEKIALDAPKVEFSNQVTESSSAISIGDFAKIVSGQNGVEYGRNKLFKVLRDKGILMENNVPYQQYIDSGYFIVIETIKSGIVYPVTRLTGKGQLWLTGKLIDWVEAVQR